MIKYFVLLFLVLIGASKTYVFYLEKNVLYYKNEIKKTLKSIDLFNIEWTYLNQHKKLKELADKYLPTWGSLSAWQSKSLEIKKTKEDKKNYNE